MVPNDYLPNDFQILKIGKRDLELGLGFHNKYQKLF